MASLGFLGALGGAGEGIAQIGQSMHQDALARRRAELQARLQADRDATQQGYALERQANQQSFQTERDQTAFEQKKELQGIEQENYMTRAREQADRADKSWMKKQDLWHEEERTINGVTVSGQTNAQTGKWEPYPGAGKVGVGGVGSKAFDKSVGTLVERMDKGYAKSFGKDFIADKDNAHIQRDIETAAIDVFKFAAMNGIDEQPERLASDFMNFASDQTRFPSLSMKNAKQKAYEEADKAHKGWGSPDPESPEILKRAQEIQRAEADRLASEYVKERYGFKEPQGDEQTAEQANTGKALPSRKNLAERLGSNASMFQEGSGEDRTPGEHARDAAGKAGGLLADGISAAQSLFNEQLNDPTNPVAAAGKAIYKGLTAPIKFTHDLVAARPKEKLPSAVLDFEATRKKGETPSKQQVAALLKWLSEGDNVQRLNNPEDIEWIMALAAEYRTQK